MKGRYFMRVVLRFIVIDICSFHTRLDTTSGFHDASCHRLIRLWNPVNHLVENLDDFQGVLSEEPRKDFLIDLRLVIVLPTDTETQQYTTVCHSRYVSLSHGFKENWTEPSPRRNINEYFCTFIPWIEHQVKDCLAVVWIKSCEERSSICNCLFYLT